MKKLVALLVFSLLLGSCSPTYTQKKSSKPNKESLEVQQIATLAFVSYAGDALKDTDAKVEETLQACIAWELTRQPILNNRFTLAWGPSVFRFKLAELDDNMMYAVWDTDKQGELVIGIRGTNFASLSDWLKEDFYVTKTVAWPYALSGKASGKITKATDIGLTALQGMTGRNHSSDNDGSILLQDFLLKNAKSGKLKKITVTGHSLAGALAPVFALWLKDQVFRLDDPPKVDIHVLPIAGATAGNADFAAYYDSRLGAEKTNRLHNPFDLVPQAWSIPSMRALPTIYITTEPAHSIRPSILESAAFDIGIELAKNKHYTHIKAQQPATSGMISMEAKDAQCKMTYASQAQWQHHCGYYRALGIEDQVYNTNSTCLSKEYCDLHQDSKECQALFARNRCTACESKQ